MPVAKDAHNPYGCFFQIKPEVAEAIYAMFDNYVDGGLAFVRKSGKEYIASVDNNLTTSLAMMLQVRRGPCNGCCVLVFRSLRPT